jgi:hypothetical protein
MIVPENSSAFWGTTAIAVRRAFSSICVTSAPSISTRPPVAS